MCRGKGNRCCDEDVAEHSTGCSSDHTLQRVFDVLHNHLLDMFMASIIVGQRGTEKRDENNDVDRHSSCRTSPWTLVRQIKTVRLPVLFFFNNDKTKRRIACFFHLDEQLQQS